VPVEELAGLSAADDTAACALDAVSTDPAVRLSATLPPDQAEAVPRSGLRADVTCPWPPYSFAERQEV
jgi:hypothetical protein